MLTHNILITGIVTAAILPPTDPAGLVFISWLPGIPLVRMVHVIAPILATVDFLVFDEHKRYPWSYAFWWLLYFPVYLAFVLVRAQIWPNSGPEKGGNPYPYGFVNLRELGWAGLGKNIVIYMAAFCIAGLLLCLIDHVLPRRTPLTGCLPGTSGSRGTLPDGSAPADGDDDAAADGAGARAHDGTAPHSSNMA